MAVMARTNADKKYAKAKAKNTCTAKLRGNVVLAWLDGTVLAEDGAVVLELLEEFMGCEVKGFKLKARPPV